MCRTLSAAGTYTYQLAAHSDFSKPLLERCVVCERLRSELRRRCRHISRR